MPAVAALPFRPLAQPSDNVRARVCEGEGAKVGRRRLAYVKASSSPTRTRKSLLRPLCS